MKEKNRGIDDWERRHAIEDLWYQPSDLGNFYRPIIVQLSMHKPVNDSKRKWSESIDDCVTLGQDVRAEEEIPASYAL